MPPYGRPPKKRRTGLIIRIIIFILFGIPAILATVALISCRLKYSSPPINESAETTSFLSDATVNDDDLRVFDTIRPAIEKKLTHESVTDYSEDEARRIVEEIRASVKSGRWNYISARSKFPLEWVRLCELAEREMHDRASETWNIIDFGYPSPSHGPIPVPATYNEGSVVAMRMECMTGRYESLVVGINYFRLTETPYYVSYENEARKRFDQMEQDLETLRMLLPDHKFLCFYGSITDYLGYEEFEEDEKESEKYMYTLHIWENDDEQEFSDIQQFATKAQQIFETVPHVTRILTLEHNYDIDLYLRQIHNYNYEDTSTVCPDSPSPQSVTEAQNLCLRNHYLHQNPQYLSSFSLQQLGVDRTDMGTDGQISPESVWGMRREYKRICTP